MTQMKKIICIFITMLLIAIAIIVGIGFAFRNTKGDEPEADMDYGKAVELTLKFLDIQKAGKLVDNKIKWRGDSALKDGSEVDVDLSKGLYDAGDHMKFGFPMAFTASIIAWTMIEYSESLQYIGQYKAAMDSLKWISDYLVNAHAQDNTLYVQVGDPEQDHKCWERPETMSETRPVSQVNETSPGSDVAGETSAALALAAMVFKEENPDYSKKLLNHSKQLFAFADKSRGRYSASLPKVQKFYNSTGYIDELLWAGAWLFRATGEQKYLDYVTGKAMEGIDFDRPTWFSWDNKLPGVEVVLARGYFFDDLSGNDGIAMFKEGADAVMCNVLPKSPMVTDSRTENGLIWVSEWNSLQHPAAHAYLAKVYSDYMHESSFKTLECDGKKLGSSDLRKFAKSQADFILGNNPEERSYLVGFGNNYPKLVHHRGASIPADQKPSCKDGFKWYESEDPNPNVATGALVGGPFKNETYVDVRSNVKQGEPTTYSCALAFALFTSLV